MKKIDIVELDRGMEQFAGKEVVIGGWIKSARSFGAVAFLNVNDGTNFAGAQIVLNEGAIEGFEVLSNLNAGSAVKVWGKFSITPENKQPYEIIASKVDVLSATGQDYPLQKKGHSPEFLREIAYLRPRTNLFNAVFRVRSEMSFALHNFFKENNFTYIHTPIITGADCEGGSDIFRVTTFDPYVEQKTLPTPDKDFFGKKVFLTPTGQLEAEAVALAFSKVYTFGPTFRSEKSNTTRHASEFWMIEPEMAFYDLQDNIELIEAMVKYLINHLLTHCKTEVEFFNKFVDTNLLNRLTAVVESDFAKVTYTEAVEILEKNNDKFQFKAYWGCDLQTEHERYLSEEVYKKPVFVYNYPKEIKAFYMRLNDDNKTVAATDLLVPGVGEMVGGSQREDREDMLIAKIKEAGLEQEDYWWYINLRKFGGVYHSGFGLGFERFLMYATGVSNIRDVILFPRTPGNCNF